MVTFSVLLVADDPLARSGLASMLEYDQFCEIIAQCHSLDLFDGFWPDEPVDIVVWDTAQECPDLENFDPVPNR